MPREIRLRLKQMLEDRGIPQKEVADRTGVSSGTIAKYCNNTWRVLDRGAIEQLIDLLGCDLPTLVEVRETPFFDSFSDGPGGVPRCIYVSRPEAPKRDEGRVLAYRDYNALQHVSRLLDTLPVRVREDQISATTRADFSGAMMQNCIVIGSPIVNSAAEIAVCHTFGVEPFRADQASKLPFHFRHPEPFSALQSSVVTSGEGGRGIWLCKEKELLRADFWPPSEFRKKEIRAGRDYGIVVVVNHLQGDGAGSRKLVILSGYTGVGTEGAALALVDSYRDLEPRELSEPVWGVVEVTYSKLPNNTRREIQGYPRWRYREGGRSPIAFTK